MLNSFLALAVVLLSTVVFAQDEEYPKVDIFAGYQWLNPGGTVPAPNQPFNAPVPMDLKSIPQGVGAAGAYNFTKFLALEGDYGGNWNKFANETTASVGPRLMFRDQGVNYFLHTMISLNRLSVKGLESNNGVGAILGGGMDIKVWKTLSLRLFEADYVWARHNFADAVSPDNPKLRRPTLNGVRLRTGLVLNLGYPNPVTPTAACSAQPTEVMVGEPVTVTATGTNFNPKHTLSYSWNSTGGKVNSKDTTATIDTNGLAGGTYTATARISDPKVKKGGEASCSATFTVKEPPKNPPTMSCSANPTSVQSGAPVALTCTCTSPDNAQVSVSNWSATGGSVSGTGTNATLNTNGAPAGPITVSATCTDNRGLTAQASTQVNVEVPPPPPPQASKLSQCDFPNEKKPWRVDNTCKAILDDVAKNLQQNADNRLVVVGNADPSEKRKNLAGERAVNSKAYLAGGEAKQGIDPSRVEVRTGSGGTKTAEYWIVPAGATFTGEGTQPVDETKVKVVPDHPAAKPAARKKKAPAAQ
jgi:outer membrane protein OmpA-like peptidoglycan-associated protein